MNPAIAKILVRRLESMFYITVKKPVLAGFLLKSNTYEREEEYRLFQ